MNNKVYIYNHNQAYYYIQNNVMPIERPQAHKKTGKVFFVFDYNQAGQVYKEWCSKHYN